MSSSDGQQESILSREVNDLKSVLNDALWGIVRMIFLKIAFGRYRWWETRAL